MTQRSNLFGSYNARHLEPAAVAESFVPQRRFWDLVANTNNLLIGPRGSGKTTLLKMLQPAAVSAWAHADRERLIEAINFIGVFVPTDLNWSEEIAVAVLALPEDQRNTLTEALFVANVQLALLTTLAQLSPSGGTATLAQCYEPLSKSEEVQIVQALEKAWNFEDGALVVPSLRSFRTSMRSRIALLSSFRPNMPDREGAVGRIGNILSRSQFNFETTFLHAIGVVDAITRKRRRWGLLFDEVELASPFLQQMLFMRLRSASAEDVLYKLAVVPHVPGAEIFNQINTPGISNDWKPIALWYTEKAEATRFCSELWKQAARGGNAHLMDPYHVFGSSEDELETVRSHKHGAQRAKVYGPRSDKLREFASLYAKDPTFRKYLSKRGIGHPDLIPKLPKDAMDSVIRKIAPLVRYRDQLIDSFVDFKPKLRSNKSFGKIYSGWEAICIVSEGNPRWFRSIIDALLAHRDADSGRVSRNNQSEELERASKRFRALVAACPVGEPVAADKSPVAGPLDFVEAIARFQRDKLLDFQFSADMPLAIESDKDCSPELLFFLSACLNVGAIIAADEELAAISLSELRGRTFRLSYLLAPSLVLPLRTGKPRSLTTIFSKTSVQRFTRAVNKNRIVESQKSLWDDWP